SWGALSERNPAADGPSELPAEVVAEAYEAIGFAAAALVATCDPGRLRIGGGLAAAWGERLLEAVRRELTERVLPDVAAATAVERGRLGDAAALVGLARSAK